MAWARENRYIVFTNDLHYGALLVATAAASPSVIQIRAEDIRPASAEHSVLFALKAAAEDLSTGALGQNSPRGNPLVANSRTSRWTSCRVRRRRALTSSGSVIRPLQQIPPRNNRWGWLDAYALRPNFLFLVLGII